MTPANNLILEKVRMHRLTSVWVCGKLEVNPQAPISAYSRDDLYPFRSEALVTPNFVLLPKPKSLNVMIRG